MNMRTRFPSPAPNATPPPAVGEGQYTLLGSVLYDPRRIAPPGSRHGN